MVSFQSVLFFLSKIRKREMVLRFYRERRGNCVTRSRPYCCPLSVNSPEELPDKKLKNWGAPGNFEELPKEVPRSYFVAVA